MEPILLRSMNPKLNWSIAAVLALGISSACAQQYVVTDLSATNSTSTNYAPAVANGLASPYQIGSGTVNNQSVALSWNGTAASVINLTPSGYKSADIFGISGSTLVGEGVMSTGQTVALLWPGRVPSPININPTIGSTPAALSEALGISGSQEVGYAENSTGGYYAYLWSGSSNNAVDLQPTSNYVSSTANATDGTQQAGFATVASGYAHAMVWAGTAASAQDLNPTGYIQSFAEAVAPTGVTNSAAVGYAETASGSGTAHAYAWPFVYNTTNDPISLHPGGYSNSFATGINSTNVVGYGTGTNGLSVALLWRGFSTNNVVNLNTYLPSGATSAYATSIDSSGNIAGYATFSGSSLTHAILWQPPVAPVITSAPISTSTTIGIPYYSKVTATGTPTPSFSLTNAAPGLSISSTGTLSGSPTATGIFSSLITAFNGISPAATQSFNLTVNPTPVQSYAVLHSFFTSNPPKDGENPNGNLVQGSDGNFYGMTPFGGTGANISGYAQSGSGIVFRLSPGGAYAVLHNFSDGSVSNDGAMPVGGLVEGGDGNYYGVTQNGGASGFGTVFKITPQGAVTILHSFSGTSTIPQDGSIPSASLLLASDGNFYGTTEFGGTAANGTLFRISSGGTYAVLHTFKNGSPGNDGQQPAAALIQNPNDGYIYGTTAVGGAGFGTLFRLSLQGSYNVVRTFGDNTYASDPEFPSALVEGTDGNLYGTATRSTTYAQEVVFNVTVNGLPSLFHFFGDGTVANDGASSGSTPPAALILGTDGNFYGTTVWGGQPPINGYGVAFKMTPSGSVTILHAFADGTAADGANPSAPLVQGSDGNLYGTTANGGTTGGGTAFQLFLTNGIANPVVIASTPAPTITLGAPLNFAFTAQGSPAPAFSVTSGSLPPGLTLSSTGILSGTPTVQGNYVFTITASNGAGSPVSQTITLAVTSQPADTPVMPDVDLALFAAMLVAAAMMKTRLGMNFQR